MKILWSVVSFIKILLIRRYIRLYCLLIILFGINNILFSKIDIDKLKIGVESNLHLNDTDTGGNREFSRHLSVYLGDNYNQDFNGLFITTDDKYENFSLIAADATLTFNTIIFDDFQMELAVFGDMGETLFPGGDSVRLLQVKNFSFTDLSLGDFAQIEIGNIFPTFSEYTIYRTANQKNSLKSSKYYSNEFIYMDNFSPLRGTQLRIPLGGLSKKFLNWNIGHRLDIVSLAARPFNEVEYPTVRRYEQTMMIDNPTKGAAFRLTPAAGIKDEKETYPGGGLKANGVFASSTRFFIWIDMVDKNNVRSVIVDEGRIMPGYEKGIVLKHNRVSISNDLLEKFNNQRLEVRWSNADETGRFALYLDAVRLEYEIFQGFTTAINFVSLHHDRNSILDTVNAEKVLHETIIGGEIKFQNRRERIETNFEIEYSSYLPDDDDDIFEDYIAYLDFVKTLNFTGNMAIDLLINGRYMGADYALNISDIRYTRSLNEDENQNGVWDWEEKKYSLGEYGGGIGFLFAPIEIRAYEKIKRYLEFGFAFDYQKNLTSVYLSKRFPELLKEFIYPKAGIDLVESFSYTSRINFNLFDLVIFKNKYKLKRQQNGTSHPISEVKNSFLTGDKFPLLLQINYAYPLVIKGFSEDLENFERNLLTSVGTRRIRVPMLPIETVIDFMVFYNKIWQYDWERRRQPFLSPITINDNPIVLQKQDIEKIGFDLYLQVKIVLELIPFFSHSVVYTNGAERQTGSLINNALWRYTFGIRKSFGKDENINLVVRYTETRINFLHDPFDGLYTSKAKSVSGEMALRF